VLAGWGRSGLARTPFCRVDQYQSRGLRIQLHGCPLANWKRGHRLGGIRPAYMRVSSYNSYYEERLINVKSSRGRRGGFAETSARQATCRRTARRRRGRFSLRKVMRPQPMTEIAARAEAPIGSLYQFFPSKESTRRHVGAKLYRVAQRRLRSNRDCRNGISPPRPSSRVSLGVLRAHPQERSATLPLAEAPHG